MKKIIIICLFSAILVILLIIVSEISFRIFFPFCEIPDKVYYRRYRPNCSFWRKTKEFNNKYSYNTYGLRNPAIKLNKEEGIKRILVLGDSFTEGWGVDEEETFSRILERKLNKDTPKFEVINGGIVGYSPLIEYLFLKKEGLKFKPDLIILNFNNTDFEEERDFYKLSYEREGEIVAVSPYKGKKSFLPEEIKNFLDVNSYFFYFLNNKLPRAIFKLKTFLFQMMGKKIIKNKKPRFDYLQDYTKSWFLLEKSLLLIKDLLEKEKIPFLLVYQPLGHQTHGKEWDKGRQFYGLEEGEVYQDEVEEIFKKFCQKHKISCLNLLDFFRNSNDFPLYYSYDGHWTNKGHRLAAEVIYNFLIKNN